jgi:hypothetical protein
MAVVRQSLRMSPAFVVASILCRPLDERSTTDRGPKADIHH